MGTRETSSITVAPLGEAALAALVSAIAEAKADDLFARVVVIAADRDVGREVLHLLGAGGLINVTVQAGERLATELARPILQPVGAGSEQLPQPLNRLHESQAVRQVADEWLEAGTLELSPAGRLRLYGELANGFRQLERGLEDVADAPPAGDAVLDWSELYARFRSLLERKGFYTRYQLPRLAASALSEHWPDDELPTVIYYLPRHPEAGELELMQKLLGGRKCRVVVGLTGDESADEPAKGLLQRLGATDTPEPGDDPLLKKAVAGSGVAIVVTPDPTEEVRAVVRRIAAMSEDVPFHRIAVTHRQEEPYASLLRQEMDSAGIPSSGVSRRTLSDTPAGRFLLGILGLAAAMASGPSAEPSIDRELWIDLITAVPMKIPLRSGADRRGRPGEVPATQWANLARASRANGTVREWTARLRAYTVQQERREAERFGERTATGGAAAGNEGARTGSPTADVLVGFLSELAGGLQPLRGSGDATWASATTLLKNLLTGYLQRREDDEQDHQRVEDLLDGLPALETWNDAYSLEVLREAISEGLQSPVSDRGRPVGSGVYVGMPAGIVGTQYQAVFVVGMVEGQFPPAHRASGVDEWLGEGGAAHIRRALERYEFLGAVAAADRVVLSYPVAGSDRRGTYPSRWLLEAANLLHNGGRVTSDRLTSENLMEDAGNKEWLTVVPSRETGLRQLASANAGAATDAIAPVDPSDYNLMLLLPVARRELSSHRAWSRDAHMAPALEARRNRQGAMLSQWDGLVGAGSTRITDIGAPNRPVSPSALEMWATCPYRYFLARVLGLAAPPGPDDEVEMSALDRGSLVHRVLEEFVKEGKGSEGELLELADVAFAEAERQGITGYPLLWEMEKDAIREGLRAFHQADADWLGDGVSESRAEVAFDGVDVEVDGLGTIRFRGKIDRLDVVGHEVRVRDFKTGRPNAYTSGPTTQSAYTVGNGRALQLPVYVAAARQMHPAADIRGSYCFPLSDDPTREGRPYTDAEGQAEFHDALRRIIGTARSGVFPATPDGEGEYSGCRFCDFNRLCPTRRRQTWERKGRQDPAVQGFNDLGGRAAIE